MTDRVRRSWFAAMLALIGGAAIIAGSLLTWLEVGGGVSVGGVSVTGTPTGTELLPGQVALGAGVVVVVFGLLLLVLRRARRLLGFLMILGGIVAIAAGAFVASSPQDRYIDFAVEKGAPAGQADEVRASLTNLFVVSNQETDLGIGVYIAIGGGALSVIAGLTAVFGRRKPKPAEAAETKEPSEPKPEGLPEEWLAARALEAEARNAPVQEPPPQELVTQAAPPPLPDPPPGPEEAALPEAPESSSEEEPVARVEEIEAPSDAAEEPAPAPEPVNQTVAPPEPSAEPAKPDDRSGWSKPLPDDWVAKPAKRRRRRGS